MRLTQFRAAEATYAQAWFQTITAEVFGLMRPPALLALAASVANQWSPAASSSRIAVVGDAIPDPLTGTPGERGARVARSSSIGASACVCSAIPAPSRRSASRATSAPDLAGVGDRLSEGQLRLRIVDSRRLDPETIMPSYYRIDGLARVGSAWQGKPVLSAEQVEDVVAFLPDPARRADTMMLGARFREVWLRDVG